jgi:hypothetical protein
MLKGLALTPPTIGRIAIGKVVERNGKRLPEKDDEFTLTSQVQHKNGWVLHPMDAILRQADSGVAPQEGPAEGDKDLGTRLPSQPPAPRGKLRTIPVRMLFNEPDLNLRANYSMFDRQTGRPLCVGNGETCKRVTATGIQGLPCPSPAACELATGGNCKPYGRLNVQVEPEMGQSREPSHADGAEHPAVDELGSFVFRTTGFNSIRTLAARLRYFHAVSGGHLSTLPLALKLRGKSTTLTHRAPIYYVDLVVRAGLSLEAAVQMAQASAQRRAAAGVDQAALDEAARQGLALGAFEESEEEGAAVVDEFYPASAEADEPGSDEPEAQPLGRSPVRNTRPLGHKLGERLRVSASGPSQGSHTPRREIGTETGVGHGSG